MSTFVSLQDVKNILGICDNSDDTQLQSILSSTLSTINETIGDISFGVKKEKFPKSMESVKNGILPLSNGPVSKITKIDATDFSSKQVDVDYIINDDGTVEVNDLSSYIETSFNQFSVEYESGYQIAPKDFIEIVATLVGIKFSKDMGREVSEQTTGPRTVKWTPSGSALSSESEVMARLRKYIPIHLFIS